MPTVDNLNIQIKANTTSAIKSLDTLEKKLSKVSASLSGAMGSVTKNNTKVASSSTKMVSGLNKTSSAMNKASKSAKSLAASFGMFYANFFLLIRGFKALWNSIESTADYIEAYNYFNVALGKIGADWKHQFEQYGYEDAKSYAESFSTRLQQSLGRLSGIQIVTTEDGKGLLTETGMSNLGMNIKEITQYASQLASVTNSVGQTAETSLAIAGSFTKLAGDISSLFNLDYASVAKNFQSGLIGQSRALYKYGIDITNATLQTYAYGLGLEKAVSEMTQAEKMQLRVLAILDQSKVAWGDLANTIESPANQIRIFKNNMSELGIIIGQLFIPMLTKVLPILNGISVAFKRIAVDIATFFGIQLNMDDFGKGYADLEENMDGVADSMEDATNATKKFKNATLGIDELNILGDQQDGASNAQGSLDLTDKIVDATKEYEKAWSDAFALMEQRVQSFADKFEKALEPVKQLFAHLFAGDFSETGSDISNLIVGISNFLQKAIESVNWEEIGRKIGDFLEAIDWTLVLTEVSNVFFDALQGALKLWQGVFDVAPVETAIITALAGLTYAGLTGSIFSPLSAKLSSVLSPVLSSAIGSVFESVVIAQATWYFGTEALAKITGDEEFADLAKERGVLGAIQDIGDAMSGMPAEIGLTSEAFRAFSEALDDIANGTIYTDEQLDKMREKWGFTADEIEDLRQAIFYANPELKELADHFESLWDASPETLQDVSKGFELIADGAVSASEAYDEFLKPMWGFNEDALKFFQELQDGSDRLRKALSDNTKSLEKDLTESDKQIVEWLNKSKFNSEKTQKDVTSIFGKLQSSLFGKGQDAMKGFADGLETQRGNVISKVSSIAQSAISAMQISILGSSVGSIAFSLPTFATGGFPEDGLFMANHNELVGGFSNGKTAVANNGQIIDGIEGGVERAVSRVLAPYLADIARNTRETADKDMSVNIGDRDIARANNRGQRQIGARLITEG